MRKTSPMTCPYCHKSLPMCLPPYHRVEKDEVSGIWRPMGGICQCNEEMYQFYVMDLAKKLNKRDSGK